MVWIITAVAILGILFAAYAHANTSEDPANEGEPTYHPTIFLKATPSEESRNSIDSAVKMFLAAGIADSDLTITRLDLPGKSFEPPGYGLYSYLLFGSSSESGKTKRYSAARGYCNIIPPIENAIELGISENKINAFFVPTILGSPAETYCKNPKVLVDVFYDYTRAKKILQDIGIEGDGIYLVACDGPILTNVFFRGCHPEKMLVVGDLTYAEENLSELCIMEFRRRTRDQEYWNQGSFNLRSLAYKFRVDLPELAKFISFAKAAAEER